MHKCVSSSLKSNNAAEPSAASRRSPLPKSPEICAFPLTDILETPRPIDGSEVDCFHLASGSQMLEVSLLSHREVPERFEGQGAKKSPSSSSCVQEKTVGNVFWRPVYSSWRCWPGSQNKEKRIRDTHTHKSVTSRNYMVCQDAALFSLWHGWRLGEGGACKRRRKREGVMHCSRGMEKEEEGEV